MIRRLGVIAITALASLVHAHPPLAGPSESSRFGTALALGDVDGDGLPDLLVGAPGFANGTGRVSLHRNTGSAFEADPTVTLSGAHVGAHFGAVLVCLGDVNGDGLADFAVAAPEYDGNADASTNRGRVVALMGSAEPPFLLQSEVATGLPDAHLGTTLAGPGDLNGDGHADLLVGGRDTISFYPGAATTVGQIETLITSVPGFATCIDRTWDVDGDGNADFLVETMTDTRLYFGVESDLLGGPVDLTRTALVAPGVAAVGDLDGDGAADLVEPAAGASFFAIGDYNGDGVPDYAQRVDQTVVVYDGATRAPSNVTCDCTPSLDWGAAVAAADLDGDGRTDLVIGAPHHPVNGIVNGVVFTHLSSATPPFQARGQWAGRVEAVGDVDDDGFDDLVVVGSSLVLVHGGATTFREVPLAAYEGSAYAIAAADFDADGRNDIAFASDSKVAVYAADGHVLWTIDAPMSVGLGDWLSAGDFDGDGHPDLLVGAVNDRGRSSASLFRGRRTGLRATPDAFDRGAPFEPGAPRYLAAGDLDGIAGMNLLAVTADATSLLASLLLDAPFPPGATALSSEADPRLVGDIDGDGFDDLLTMATATFVPVGDVDRDGRMDLAATNPLRVVHGPDFVRTTSIAFAAASVAPAGDVDGDGAADLLVSDGHSVQLLTRGHRRFALRPRARDFTGDHTLQPEVGTRESNRFRIELDPTSLTGRGLMRLEVIYAPAGVSLDSPSASRVLSPLVDARELAPAPLSLPIAFAKGQPGQAIRWRARLRPALLDAPIQTTTPWFYDTLGPRTGQLRLQPHVVVVAYEDRYEMYQDDALYVRAPGLLGNDRGPASSPEAQPDSFPLTLDSTPVVAPRLGSLALFADGSFAYTPRAGAWGDDQFVYRTFDADNQSATAEVSLHIKPIRACIAADEATCRGALLHTTLARRDGSLLTITCEATATGLACTSAPVDNDICPLLE